MGIFAFACEWAGERERCCAVVLSHCFWLLVPLLKMWDSIEKWGCKMLRSAKEEKGKNAGNENTQKEGKNVD